MRASVRAPCPPAVIDPKLTPRRIVEALDRYVIGQDDAKRIVAVAVYAHFRKVARAAQRDASIAKSNVLLIGPTGTGKTLLCETLSRILGVPFVTAEATSLAQTRYVNDEIEAMLQRLVEKAGGDVDRARHGIVFIDEIDKLKSTGKEARVASGERPARAPQDHGGLADQVVGDAVRRQTNMLFICGGAFVGLDDVRRDARLRLHLDRQPGQQADPRSAQLA
jgi:ATP-dependent Clp protease ATP-binding subunit ClpX